MPKQLNHLVFGEAAHSVNRILHYIKRHTHTSQFHILFENIFLFLWNLVVFVWSVVKHQRTVSMDSGQGIAVIFKIELRTNNE